MKKYIFIALIIAISLIPKSGYARSDTYTLLEPLPCITGVTAGCSAGQTTPKIEIKDYILYVYKFFIAIAVFLAIIMIIWGGFNYITSEVPFIKSDGRSKIEGAVTGLAFVLVSYLILSTIDPRLVNVDTDITPIKISQEDLDSLNRFHSQLELDLKNASIEGQLKYEEDKRKIKDLEAEKKDIEEKIGREELTGADLIKAEEDIAKINSQLRTAKTDQSVALAKNTGKLQFANALYNINNPKETGTSIDQYIAPTVPNTPDAKGYLPETTNNIIQQDYNRRINEIKKTISASDGSDAIAKANVISVLEKQRDFMVEQVKEEVKIVNTKVTTVITGGQGSARTINNTEGLVADLARYRADLIDTKKMESSGLLESEYKNIMQTRIVVTEKKLNPPKP